MLEDPEKKLWFGSTGFASVLPWEIEIELKNWLLKMARCGAPIPKFGVLFSVQYRPICAERKIITPFKNGLPGLFLKCAVSKHDDFLLFSECHFVLCIEGEKWFNNFIA